MFEKYNAIDVGQPGQGGEYAVQDGFGWTNGVVLRYLSLYGASLTLPASCPSSNTVRSYYVNAEKEHVELRILPPHIFAAAAAVPITETEEQRKDDL